ncbi:hypothetical protein TanjilG_31129 [Lupinus angustifolius]|uniref:Rho-GAP domain-containing protein n=1 Tax=Lupinus angustifolius TaxID=3871 RepID=A0A1J7GVQ0_LUPAN|nr:PREDICTED: rho GTPase-activating protein 5 [Lupinus angustifolius]XP_019425486.1 PREDICTED: rho GTPase-activating protein 5 [Lupinus angustifolius]OIV92210.1 hypothetical protein TanjilG_31129 [Lupinus angustifolius]
MTTELLQLPSPSTRSCVGHDALINDTNPTQQQGEEEEEEEERDNREGDQLSFLTLFIDTFKKSVIGTCTNTDFSSSSSSSMEIGWPSNVRHVAHVTFHRFHGFLGLPLEFQPQLPPTPPSASASVFGVSTESMQLSFDARGNSIPTILLLMQRRLYTQGGLQAEGIFRINAENGQEEFVREQLNRGVVPDGTDVHCLAGLIKAWFRELPTGVLDPLSPEQVMQSQSEEECAQLVRLLPPTEAALLDWAINLMADVAQLEHLNKMNVRNVAMVFAPNMTHMVDPLTALMYAVQVMNFLKTLVEKALREREESMGKSDPISNLNSFDDDGHHSSSEWILKDDSENENDSSEEDTSFVTEEPSQQSPIHVIEDGYETESGSKSLSTSEKQFPGENRLLVDSCPCNVVSQLTSSLAKENQANICKSKSLQLSTYNMVKCSKKLIELSIAGPVEKSMGSAIIGRINSRSELTEAWR